MTIHSIHPDTHTDGLSDDCLRCTEHAEHPELSLDAANIGNLMHRIVEQVPPRSKNEGLAMQNLVKYLEESGNVPF